MDTRIQDLYQDYENMPYISPDRNIDEWLELVRLKSQKLVPKRNMESLGDGLLAGHIILLWRISFGTYTNQTWVVKYFEYTYGIDAIKELEWLLQQGYIKMDSAYESLKHITAPFIRDMLQSYVPYKLNKLKKEELQEIILDYMTEDKLEKAFSIRGYSLLPKGEEALKAHSQVVDRHPKKNL